MDLKGHQAAKEVLKTKLGQFYYKAKLGRTPKPEDLFTTTLPDGKVIPNFGALSGFINWFANIHKGKDLFGKLIKKVTKLSQSGEGRVTIVNQMVSFPFMMQIEEQRKRHYQKVYKAEYQRHQREKRRLSKKYENAIRTIKELNPGFDEEFLGVCAQDKVDSVEPSLGLRQIEYAYKYGLIWSFRQAKKSTKGLDILRGFVYSVYSVAKEYSGLSDNAIYVEIASILDLLKIRNSKGGKYTRQAVERLNKNYIAFLQEDPSRK